MTDVEQGPVTFAQQHEYAIWVHNFHVNRWELADGFRTIVASSLEAARELVSASVNQAHERVRRLRADGRMPDGSTIAGAYSRWKVVPVTETEAVLDRFETDTPDST